MDGRKAYTKQELAGEKLLDLDRRLELKMALDDRVSTSQVQKALKSLMSYAAKKKQETIDEGKTLFAENDEENVWLVVATKIMHPQVTLKPQRMQVYPISTCSTPC